MKKKFLSIITVFLLISVLFSCASTSENIEKVDELETHIKPFIGILQVKPKLMTDLDPLTPDEVIAVYTASKSVNGESVTENFTYEEIESYAKHFSLSLNDMKLAEAFVKNEDSFKPAELPPIMQSYTITEIKVMSSEEKEVNVAGANKTSPAIVYEIKVTADISLSDNYTYETIYKLTIINPDKTDFILYNGEVISGKEK